MKISIVLIRILLYFCFLWLSSFSFAAPDKSISHRFDPVTISQQLAPLQKQLDILKQLVVTNGSEIQLTYASQQLAQLNDNVNALSAVLNQQQVALSNQLAALGPPQAKESDRLIQTRHSLLKQQQALHEQINQTNELALQANNLTTQLAIIKHNMLKRRVSTSSASLLDADFWQPILQPENQSIKQFVMIKQQASYLVSQVWQKHRFIMLLCSTLAFITLIVGHFFCYKLLNWFIETFLPMGHIRKSFFAVISVLITLLLNLTILQLFITAFTYHQYVPPALMSIIDALVPLITYTTLILSLGNALLANHKAKYRLLKINDQLAKKFRFFPPLSAILLFIFGFLINLDLAVTQDKSASIFINGLLSLIVALLSCTLPLMVWHDYRHRPQYRPISKSIWQEVIYCGLFLIGLLILGSLLIGYIGLACFLSYQLLWVSLVGILFYFIFNLVIDVIDSIFHVGTIGNLWLTKTLHLDTRHQALLNVLIKAAVKILFILLALLVMFNSGLGDSLIIHPLYSDNPFFSNSLLQNFNLVPAKLLVAFIALISSIAALRFFRRWLAYTILPKTDMEHGLQLSLLTLVTNIGYIVVITVTFASLGITWHNLAWIVSALSVGIGFSLQEIVKNFISGIILLTERPVNVGDLVSINGIEGDILRINVRATEIRLSDKSTVIVPNSQFISQNVRNVTMGHAPGVVQIELKLTLDSDPNRVKEILLNAYQNNNAILATPPAKVLCTKIEPEGIVLIATGNISNPRNVSDVKSDLLFTILTALHQEKIALANSHIIQINPPSTTANDIV